MRTEGEDRSERECGEDTLVFFTYKIVTIQFITPFGCLKIIYVRRIDLRL